MKRLFVVSAWVEAIAGIVLMVSPALAVTLLVGATLDATAGLIVSRVAGAALLALALCCWLARNDVRSQAARGIVGAMLLYNVVVVALLLYTSLGMKLSGVGLWPAVLLHLILAAWCIACFRPRKHRD